MALADVDAFAADDGPSRDQRAAELFAAPVGRSDLEVKVGPFIDERFLHPPDLGIDLGMVHVEDEERVSVHDPGDFAERGDEIATIEQMIERVVEAGDA